MSATSNRKKKDRQKRKRLRDRLAAAGVPAAEVEKIIALRRADDRYRREEREGRHLAPTREEILAQTDDSLWPDDTGYRPRSTDPLLTGAARPTGIAARVSRRRHTITENQYDREGRR